MRLMILAVLVIGAVVAGAPDDGAFRREIEAWQKKRDARLRADDGWLTLAGLFWLKPGSNRFGADSTNDIVVTEGGLPPRAGAFVLDDHDHVTVEMSPGTTASLRGQPVTSAPLRSDADGAAPDILSLGPSLTMQVIERNGRLAIRLKNRASKARREFRGLRYYPANPRYRITARFVAHATPVSISVPSVLGGAELQPSPGYAQFEIDGRTFRLDPIVESPNDPTLFFVFRDLTTGKTTYGAGRFLYAEPARDGQVVLDFNKAFTPPCAFTPFATCPLPPAQNRLPVAIEAGELFEPHH